MYKLKECKIIVEGKEYSTYGIYYSDDFYIKDISTDKKAVGVLAQRCNEENLDPIHLCDIVEDFLAEAY